MNTNELDTITAAQLRRILFFVQDGSKTIEELQHELFNVDMQNTPVEIGFGMFERMARLGEDEADELTAEEWQDAYGETAEEHEAARAAYEARFPDDPRGSEAADGDTSTGDDYQLAAMTQDTITEAGLMW